MIRIAGINENDFVNGKGVSVSLFLQGCPFHCKGCHNPETWNPDGGEIWDWNELINHILELITANGIQRNLSILGGEPLDTYDKRDFIRLLIKVVKSRFPDIVICIWTGYTYDQLIEIVDAGGILANIDYLIEGPFILEQRDITLKWRGSRNQNILNLKEGVVEND
jgi:anaerobic ribonucleoside-triphosphate reductase activating protein